jgi:hypothetical protein
MNGIECTHEILKLWFGYGLNVDDLFGLNRGDPNAQEDSGSG